MDYAIPGRAAGTRYGGFWVRFVAFIVDVILIGIVDGILAAVLDSTSLELTIGTVLGWLYYAGMESSSRQATIGKSLLGLRVTGMDGRRISFLRATGRYFATILSALVLFIGYIMVAFTEKKQGLHDLIAGTLVVKGT